jgi:hypothetical protein
MTAIKRTDIGDVVRSYTPAETERKRTAEVVKGVKRHILPLYQHFLDTFDRYSYYEANRDYIRQEGPGFEPEEINNFVAQIPLFEDHDNFSNSATFISWLIQDSYRAGHNGFNINQPTPIWRFGERLKGTQDNPIRIDIIGDCGQNFAHFAQYCIFNIKGDVDYDCGGAVRHCVFDINGNASNSSPYSLGAGSRDSVFRLTGNAGEIGQGSGNTQFKIGGNVWICGRRSSNSRYEIDGNVSGICGKRSKRSTYIVGGDVGELCGFMAENSRFDIGGSAGKRCRHKAKNCTFTFHDEKTAKRVARRLVNGNKVIWRRPDDSKQIWRE